MPFQTEGIVVKNGRIKSLYFILWIYCPPIANQVKPGQFVMLKVSDDRIPLLDAPSVSTKATRPTIQRRGKGVTWSSCTKGWEKGLRR